MKKQKPKINAAEKVSANRRELVDTLIKQMESGELPWKKGWKCIRPYNPVQKITYKAGNRLRLQYAADCMGYTDPRWCTYLQAKEQGWSIKAGEKGILCERWIFDETRNIENPDTGEIEKVKVPRDIPYVNYFYVFNGSQIEGIPKYRQPSAPDPDQNLKLAQKLISSSACPIYHDGGDRAYYVPDQDSIHLPDPACFFSNLEYLATALHEMGHSTGHESRLKRNIQNKFGTENYAKEELVAELTSVFSQADFEIDLPESQLENSSAYLQNWIKCLKEEPNVLFSTVADAEKASEFLEVQYAKHYDLQIKIDMETGRRIFVQKEDDLLTKSPQKTERKAIEFER